MAVSRSLPWTARRLFPEPVLAAAQRVPSPPALRRRLGLGLSGLFGGIGARRVLAGILLVGGLPLLTLALSARRLHLDLGDDLLIYLVAVVAVAVVGGFWPAVLAAVTASLLVNWYFTPPVHTLTIADGKSLLALLLFVTVAVTVSSVVHLAALRARQAARSTEEAAGPAGPGPDGPRRPGHASRRARAPDREPRRPGRSCWSGRATRGYAWRQRGRIPAARCSGPRPGRT